MLFQDRQSVQIDFCHTPNLELSKICFRVKDLVRDAATRLKTALAILQF